MAAVWYSCAALLLVLYAALVSAGSGRVLNFTVNDTSNNIQLDAQSKVLFNCTVVKYANETSRVRIRKTELNNPQISIEISSEEDLLSEDSRYTGVSVINGATPGVKSYIVELARLEDTDNSTYTCRLGNNSASIKVNVSAVPHFRCNKTVFVDRKSGKLSMECPLFAYNLQSIAVQWTYSQKDQVILRINDVVNGSVDAQYDTRLSVNYTLRLVPADPDKGIPYKVNLTISNIERVPELFKTTFHFKASGEKGQTDHEIIIHTNQQPGPVHGDATKRQTWFSAPHYLITVVLTLVYGLL